MFGGRFLEKSLPNNYMCNLYPYIEIHNRHNHEIQPQAASHLWVVPYAKAQKHGQNASRLGGKFMPNLEDHPTYPQRFPCVWYIYLHSA